MQERISPAKRIAGSICLPGDKSISHRYAMLAAVAEGASRIQNYSTGADCQTTLEAIRALGIEVEQNGAGIIVYGRGLEGLRAPVSDLDAGNSASTIRMLAGILAAQPFTSRIKGDESLSRRPMERIIQPLAEMGASISARDGRYPPLEIRGARLRPIDYSLSVPSAQVKTCILFAALFAEGLTVVRERIQSRDHTEIALGEFGASIRIQSGAIHVRGPCRLRGRDLVIASDLSSATFFIVAALLVPGSDLVIRNVGLNPTRAALLDFLMSMGAHIRILNRKQQNGELLGTLRVQSSSVRGGLIEKQMTAALIDEIPALAVLGAKSDQGLAVRDARELRVKETDRIATIAENLARMGVRVEVYPDGFVVPGRQHFRAARLDSFGDHRIAMAFAVAALCAGGESVIERAEAASVSFPEFFDTLKQVAG